VSLLGRIASSVPFLRPAHRWVRALRVSVRETSARLDPVAPLQVMVSEDVPLTAPAVAGSSNADPGEESYLAFENVFYDPAVVDEKMGLYVPYLAGDGGARPDGDVVDLGCGRGELLRKLVAAGLDAVGVETNRLECDMLRADGFRVEDTDAVSYLEGRPDSSLAGAALIQVIEHVDPDYLLRLLALLGTKVSEGGAVVIETPNPACLAVHGNFYYDLTHRRLYPAATVRFHLARCGFRSCRTVHLMPCPEPYRVEGSPEANYTDYALIARR